METTTIENVMKNFHTNLGSEKLKWMLEQFTGTKTIEEMFTFFWDFEESHQYLQPNLIPSGKSQEEAEKLMKEGDNYLKEKCLNKALEQYDLCIMNAPHPVISLNISNKEKRNSKSDEKQLRNEDYSFLARAYAKRSAVLLDLKHFDHCLSDIKLALAYGYPNSSGDLEDRKAKCLTLQDSSLIENYKVLHNCKAVQNIPKLADPDPLLPVISNGLKLAYSAEKGRHLMAERDFRPGEVLVVEKSCCSSIDFVNLSSYCTTCLMKCLAPLPCPDCSMVVFCSEACRVEGLLGDHWLECCLLPTMKVMGIQPVFSIPFKLLRRYSCDQWRSFLQQLQETKDFPSDTRQPSKNELSNLRDFESTYHIVTNKDLRPSGDLYVKCLIAFLLTKLLQQSERFFINSCEEAVTPTRDDLLFTGQILFSNVMKVSCNGFKLVEFMCSGHYSEMRKKGIGSGIFPVLCLSNHSCHPNAEPYLFGSTQVLRASRSIKAGSEVTENYCKGFYLHPKEYRQKYLLSVYQFHCTCEACEANWPVYILLPATLQFSCLDCLQPVSDGASMCMKCFLDYERKDYEPSKQLLVDEWCNVTKEVRCTFEKSQQIATKMMSGEVTTETDFNAICKAVELMDKHVPFPCQPFWDAHDALDLYIHLERERDLHKHQV